MFVFLLKLMLPIVAAAWIAQTVWMLLPTLGSAVPTTSYSSCAELREDFPSGLAATQTAADQISPHPRRAPRVHPDGYVLNLDLDRDHDGVMCATRA